jgi:prepilin-type N-terminal cleavage/methylation domain-containing protein
MKKSLARFRLSRLSSFTLVELLVVIAIIAILAGVILSAGTAALRAALRAKAANTATQIQTACLAYYSEYGVYPIPTDLPTAKDVLIDDQNSTGDWKNLLYALCGNINPYNSTTTAPSSPPANTRAVVFLTLKSSDVDLNNAPLNPLPPDTTHLYFNIALDGDYDGILGTGNSAVTTMPEFSPTFSKAGGGASTSGVAVWANCNLAGASYTNAAFYVHTY